MDEAKQHLAVRLHVHIRSRYSGSFMTSETTGVSRQRRAIKNLAAYFFNSGDPDTVVGVHSRKNGANGNLTCSIGSSNALGQDTSHSDSLAVGDDYDFSFASFACENAAGTSFNTFMTIKNNPMLYVASIVFHMDWSFKSVPDPHLRTVQYL
jgi:hypothetical protein